MEGIKRAWFRLPRTIRRPIVLIVGCLIILAAALTGPLPGPGGIPLFLVGIALLSTEFEWAKKVRDYIIGIIERLGKHWRRHKIVGTLLVVLAAAGGITLGIITYRHIA